MTREAGAEDTRSFIKWLTLVSLLPAALLTLLLTLGCGASGNVSFEQVRVVYAPPGIPGARDGLWGAKEQDQEALKELLYALAQARLIVSLEEARRPPWKLDWVHIRYEDGSESQIGRVYECTSTATSIYCGRKIPNQFYVDGKGIVESPELEKWFQTYFPQLTRHVEWVVVPRSVKIGETFEISGAGWLEGDRVSLSVKVSEGNEIHLGEVPLEFGRFVWRGTLPPHTPPGTHSLRVDSGHFRTGRGITVTK